MCFGLSIAVQVPPFCPFWHGRGGDQVILLAVIEVGVGEVF